jgi:hypothetical protein
VHSEFEKAHSRAISKIGGVLLILLFFVVAVPSFFMAADLTLGPVRIVGATITLVFSPFFFFGLSRYLKNRDASVSEALKAKDKTFKTPDGHTLSLSQLILAFSCAVLLPVYLISIHGPLIDVAIGQFEIDGKGTVGKTKSGVALVSFERKGKKYVVPVPGSFETGRTVFVCLPPNGDVSQAQLLPVRGPHTRGGIVAMAGLHFLLGLAAFSGFAALFFGLRPKP